MTFKEEARLTEALEPYKVMCSCGHRVVITNKYKRKICNWCGNMVYLNEEEQKKHDFKNNLEKEIRRLLNERTIY